MQSTLVNSNLLTPERLPTFYRLLPKVYAGTVNRLWRKMRSFVNYAFNCVHTHWLPISRDVPKIGLMRKFGNKANQARHR